MMLMRTDQQRDCDAGINRDSHLRPPSIRPKRTSSSTGVSPDETSTPSSSTRRAVRPAGTTWTPAPYGEISTFVPGSRPSASRMNFGRTIRPAWSTTPSMGKAYHSNPTEPVGQRCQATSRPRCHGGSPLWPVKAPGCATCRSCPGRSWPTDRAWLSEPGLERDRLLRVEQDVPPGAPGAPRGEGQRPPRTATRNRRSAGRRYSRTRRGGALFPGRRIISARPDRRSLNRVGNDVRGVRLQCTRRSAIPRPGVFE